MILRLAGLFSLVGLLIDIEVFLFIYGFIGLHINLGLHTIIYDYIHIEKIKILLLYLIRISIIEIFKHFLDLFL